MCKIRYMRLNKHYHSVSDGAITIVSDLKYGDNKTAPTSLDFAVAFTNPHDNFVKKIGRAIATARLVSKDNKYHISIPLNSGRKLRYWEINAIIETYIASVMASPTWVRDFVEDYNFITR